MRKELAAGMLSLETFTQGNWIPSRSHCQSGFHTGFSVWGGDVVCGLTGMGEYFSQVTPRNGTKSIVFHFADKYINTAACHVLNI